MLSLYGRENHGSEFKPVAQGPMLQLVPVTNLVSFASATKCMHSEVRWGHQMVFNPDPTSSCSSFSHDVLLVSNI